MIVFNYSFRDKRIIISQFKKMKKYLFNWYTLVIISPIPLCLLAYYFNFKLEYEKEAIMKSMHMIIGFSLVLYSIIFSLMGNIINSISEISSLFKNWGSFIIRKYFR